MMWIWDNAEKIGTLLTAASAVAALVYAHLAITESRRAERHANAHELWRDYLRLAFEHPNLADPSLHLADFDYHKLTIDGSAELFQRYEWFVGTLLDACVEILDFMPTKEWRATLRSQLQLHRDYLRSPHFLNSEFSVQYNPRFQKFIAASVAEPSKASVSIVRRMKTTTKRKAKEDA
jgi:hypothetical protein